MNPRFRHLKHVPWKTLLEGSLIIIIFAISELRHASVATYTIITSISARLNGVTSAPQSPKNDCRSALPVHGSEGPSIIDIYPVDIRPNSIGLLCSKYVTASEIDEDKYTNFFPSGKRKICNNRECATNRFSQPVKKYSLRVCRWIKKAPDSSVSE